MDVMPALERVLGFTNRWYRQARKQSEERELPGRVRIRAVTAPLFLATKIEAFRSRGRGDFVASHDLEDLIAVAGTGPMSSITPWASVDAVSWDEDEAGRRRTHHRRPGEPPARR